MIVDKPADFAALTAGFDEVQPHWMPATAVRPIIHGDPCLLWLQLHGRDHGFQPDSNKYDFLGWISRKAKEFELAWLRSVAHPHAVQSCEEAYLVRHARYVHKTLELMAARVPVIYQAAMWDPELGIYGTADVIVLKSWLRTSFPALFEDDGTPDCYVAGDLKFQTGLATNPSKNLDYLVASAQVRLYSAMLAHLQQESSKFGILITRDRPLEPLRIEANFEPGGELDAELAQCLSIYHDIKANGHEKTPWNDPALRPNLQFTSDGPWHSAKQEIASSRIEGGMPEKLYYVGKAEGDLLRRLGYPTLQSMLDELPGNLPLRRSAVGSRQIAILQANRTGKHIEFPAELIPPRKPVELYVDFESFTGINCDFDTEWPNLVGKEMAAFLIGIGQMTENGWSHKILVAPSEGCEGEAVVFEQFVDYLGSLGVIDNPADCAIYHWSGYEKWQTQKAIERIRGRVGFELESIRNRYVDLCTVMQAGPIAIPGMWDFSIKSVIKALSAYDPRFGADYPDDGVMEGASAMVAGWRMYESPKPCETDEYADLCGYLEVDCRAMHQILSWLRDAAR